MKETELNEYNIADMVMERPLEFYIEEERYNLYPITLGKSYLMQRLVSSLGINKENVQISPFLEALRLCKSNGNTVARIIAYSTIKDKETLFDDKFVSDRTRHFLAMMETEDMAKLLLYILTSDKVEECIKYLGLDKEREDQKRVLRVKNKGSLQ